MRKRAKKFKPTPKKHHPKSLTIIYEDHDVILVDKPSGLLTMSNDRERDKTAYAYLNDYVRKGVAKSRKRVFIVHRLDRETSGILVFAKHPEAQAYLQREWTHFQKNYYAVVHGKLAQKTGTLTSYLAENGIHKMYSTKDSKNGKLSQTAYRVVRESKDYSLLDINLLTGRKHQIRVHLADHGHPVLGDKKYGLGEKGIKRLTLHASSITITHPFSQEKMSFKTETPPYFESFMKGGNAL